jgi:CubicO group peptidase (beta-lactamase class C family)
MACSEMTESETIENANSLEGRFELLAKTFEAERTQGNVPGAALAILQGGHVVYAQGFGTKRLDEDVPVDENTLFRIGSVTKTLTATAVMQLVESERLALDRPLTDVLERFRFSRNETWANTVSTRHLLTHTSGIVDGLRSSNEVSSRANAALGAFAYDEFAKSAYLMAPPGAFYNYSNPNYMLLGLMLETVSAQDYASYVTENVLLPLHMNRTLFHAEDVRADGNFAQASTCMGIPDCDYPKGAVEVEPEAFDMAWIRPAAGAWSSVLDLTKLGQFLLKGNDEVLGDDRWLAMVTGRVDMHDAARFNDYGYGVAVTRGVFLGPDEFYDLQSRSHGGATEGYSANVTCYQELDFCMVTLASAENAYFPESRAVALRTLNELPPRSPTPNVGVDPAKYPDYVGRYEDRFNLGTVEVTTHEDKLWVDLPDVTARGQSFETELVPWHSDSFLMTVNGNAFPVTFIPGNRGHYQYLRARNAVATRTFEVDDYFPTNLD